VVYFKGFHLAKMSGFFLGLRRLGILAVSWIHRFSSRRLLLFMVLFSVLGFGSWGKRCC